MFIDSLITYSQLISHYQAIVSWQLKGQLWRAAFKSVGLVSVLSTFKYNKSFQLFFVSLFVVFFRFLFFFLVNYGNKLSQVLVYLFCKKKSNIRWHKIRHKVNIQLSWTPLYGHITWSQFKIFIRKDHQTNENIKKIRYEKEKNLSDKIMVPHLPAS